MRLGTVRAMSLCGGVWWSRDAGAMWTDRRGDRRPEFGVAVGVCLELRGRDRACCEGPADVEDELLAWGSSDGAYNMVFVDRVR